MGLSITASYATNISDYIPKIRLASPEQVTKNLTKIAIPTITLAALTMINSVQSIPFTECIDNCNKHRDVHDLAKLLCYTLCWLFAKK